MVTSLVFKAKNESVNKQKKLGDPNPKERNDTIWKKAYKISTNHFYTRKTGGGAFTSQKLQKPCFAISKRFFLDPKYKSVLV